MRDPQSSPWVFILVVMVIHFSWMSWGQNPLQGFQDQQGHALCFSWQFLDLKVDDECIITGLWFGTFGLFFHILGRRIPTD